MSVQKDNTSITVKTLTAMKQRGEKIACLTAYDASFAAILDSAGVDVILVGDSLGMVIQGHHTTLPVTMDEMVYHTQAVARGCRKALLMADMPFLSYTTPAEALRNAGRFMKEASAQMVKLESGTAQAEVIRVLADEGIPVCAHLGLRPQSVYKLGGYKVQGRDPVAAESMLQEATAFVQAGADMILLECVPDDLAKRITNAVKVPVIGIGAGAACDGQVLVLYDILGITRGKQPKFTREYLAQAGSIDAAVQAYVSSVKTAAFPTTAHSFD